MTDTTYRRGNTPAANGTFSLTGSQHLVRESVRNAQMLRNYMNEGGKVVFTGRNGWQQQLGTSTGLNTYSNYTWWQEPVYGFDYPPNQAGDDDRPHTAFFRELDISNDWAQWWLGVGVRQGGVGTTTYNASTVSPCHGRHPRRDEPDRARHHGRLRRDARSRRRTRPRARPSRARRRRRACGR